MISFIRPTCYNNWLEDFYINLKKGFEELGESTELINIEEVKNNNPLILLDHRHINNPFLDSISNLKITHQHSTACIPHYWMNDLESEKNYSSRSDYIIFTNTDFEKNQMLKILKPANEIVTAGFPFILKQIYTKKKHKTIVMTGRLNSDRQYLLGLSFLVRLHKEGFETTFSVLEKDRHIFDREKLVNYEYHGVKFQFNNKEQFYKLLEVSEFFLSTSLPETLGISVVEAIQHGCKVLLPFEEECSYKEIVSNGYEPYSYNSIKNLIYNYNVTNNIDWLDYKKVANVYLKTIKEYEKTKH